MSKPLGSREALNVTINLSTVDPSVPSFIIRI